MLCLHCLLVGFSSCEMILHGEWLIGMSAGDLQVILQDLTPAFGTKMIIILALCPIFRGKFSTAHKHVSTICISTGTRELHVPHTRSRLSTLLTLTSKPSSENCSLQSIVVQ